VFVIGKNLWFLEEMPVILMMEVDASPRRKFDGYAPHQDCP
jgi:hypothetical protein